MNGISSKWVQHLQTPHEREEFKNFLLRDEVVLGRLYAILEDFEKELDQRDFSIEEYNSPAFPYLKADRNGERRAISKIKQLLQFINRQE